MSAIEECKAKIDYLKKNNGDPEEIKRLEKLVAEYEGNVNSAMGKIKFS